VPQVFKEPTDASPEEGDSAEVHQHDDDEDEQHTKDDAQHNDGGFVAGQPSPLNQR
jgi:hypothetical protein